MKKLKLSSAGDGAIIKLSLRSEVSYSVIKKIKEGIVITSKNSNRSFVKSGKIFVYFNGKFN